MELYKYFKNCFKDFYKDIIVEPDINKIKKLLNDDSSIYINKQYNDTALMLYLEYSKKLNYDIIKLLIYNGYDVNEKNIIGYDSIILFFLNTSSKKTVKVLNLLFKYCKNINYTNKNYNYIDLYITFNASKYNIYILKLLIKKGLKINKDAYNFFNKYYINNDKYIVDLVNNNVIV